MSKKKASARLLCAAAMSALCGGVSLAQTIQWNNASGGTFSVGTNWLGLVAPGPANSAQFALNSAYTTTFTTSPTNINLNVSAGTVTFTTATAQAYNLTGSAFLSGGSLTSNAIQWDIANSLNVSQGSRLLLQSNSDMTVGSMLLGNGSAGTVIVSGSTSSLQTDNPTGTSLLGQNGGAATLTFQSSAVGTFAGHLSLAQSGVANSTGVLQVISGADITLAGNLNVGASGVIGQVGDLFISGIGSTFTQTGASVVNIGAAANSVGTLFLSGGATFSSGTGTVTVNPTGYLEIGGTGTFTANGSVRINGGTLTRAATGAFIMPSGTLTVENGGSANFNGAQTFSAGQQINVLSGGKMLVNPGLTLSNGAVATADGASSQLSGGSLLVGADAAATFSNAASGTFTGDVTVGGSSSGGSALRVSSGGSLTTTNIHIGTSGVAGVLAELSLNHGTSSITQTGASVLNVGTTSSSFGSLNISGGNFTSGTGEITVRSTGSLGIFSGTLNANGNINVSGGSLNQAGGALNIASGRNLTVSDGGQYFGLGFQWNNGGVLTVTGSGSGLNTSGINVSGGGTIQILAGGDATLTSSLTLGNSGNGFLEVDGVGSTFRAANSNIGVVGEAGTAIFRNSSAGTFTGALTVGSFGPGNLSVLSGATLTVPSLQIGGTLGSFHAGTVTLDGASSRITLGSGSLNLGGSMSLGAGTLILNARTFDAGTVAVNVYSGSRITSNGGRLSFAGSLLVDAGTLEFTNGNNLGLAGASTVTVRNGGVASIGGTLSMFDDSLYVGGPTSQVTTGSSIQHYGTGTISITAGADVVSGVGSFNLGRLATGNGTMIVDGAGSSFVASGSGSQAIISGDAGGRGTVIFRNASSGTFNGGLSLVTTGSISTPITSYGTFSVLSGSDVTFDQSMAIATLFGDALFEVSGPGSMVRHNGSGTLQLSDDLYSGPATLSVSNGGAFIASANQTFLHPQSIIQITDGTVQLGTLNALGGQVQFNSGTFSYLGDLLVGSGGLLGANPVIDSTKHLGNSGTTTINPGSTLNITGGSFKTGTIVNNGSFSWAGGSLDVTAGGIAIGSGGLIPTPQNLDASRSLKVGGQLSLLAGAQVNLVGGTINAGSLNLAGTLVHEGGMFAVASDATITSAGRLFVESNQLASVGGTLSNSGRVELLGGAARVSAATFANSGTLSGDGEISAAFSNSGEVRAEAGDSLLITSAASTNSGRINLLGGGVEFSGSLANSGTISGRGSLHTAGLTNTATVSYSGGFADHFGALTNNNGGKVIVTGGALATFYSNVIANAGSEFRVSNGTAVFLGTVTGTTNFTGSGVKIFENTASPGPLATTGSTIVEIGGSVSVPHIREIALTLYGPMTITPNGTTAGTSRLNLLTIDGGTLDLNDNDLIIDYDGASPIDEIRDHLFTGAMFSSIADASSNPKFALGYIESSGNGTFSGQPVDGTSLIIAYTLRGDGNLDGKVNTLDFNMLAGAFGQSNQHCVNGDYDYNGVVDSQDFNYFVANHGYSFNIEATAALGTLVPEPAAGAALLFPGVILARRRGQRSTN